MSPNPRHNLVPNNSEWNARALELQAQRRYSLLLEPAEYEFYNGRDFEKDFAPKKDSRHCAYCGIYGGHHIDHIIPKSRGGSDEPCNLVWACAGYNTKKGARTPREAGMVLTLYKESMVGKSYQEMRGYKRVGEATA